MKLKHTALTLALTASALVPLEASAWTQREADIRLQVTYAASTAGHKNRKGAEAFCRHAKSMLTKKAEDAYLFAYIERCYGLVGEIFKDTPVACKHYKKSLEVWTRSPPPNDHPQSVASREQLKLSMQAYLTQNCKT